MKFVSTVLLVLIFGAIQTQAQETQKLEFEYSTVGPEKAEACNRATGTGRRMALEKCKDSKPDFDVLELGNCKYEELTKDKAPSEWKATIKVIYGCLPQ